MNLMDITKKKFATPESCVHFLEGCGGRIVVWKSVAVQ
jgi:hypothetical protein